MASSSSSPRKNDEVRVAATESFKTPDKQKSSAIPSMAGAGKPIQWMRIGKIVMIFLLLVLCSKPVAAVPRPLNNRVLFAKAERGPVPPSGPSPCTTIPGGKGGHCGGKHG